MPEIFVDTSGWATWIDNSQPFHGHADALMRQWQGDGTRLLTTNYVLAELVALLTSPLRMPRPTLITLVDDIRSAQRIEMVHVDPALEQAAWALLVARPDKEWSLVDCASFVVMQQRNLLEALTTDHHFEQAGFVRLLK